MNLCKDCKHCEGSDTGNYEFAFCNAPKNCRVDPVTGSAIRRWTFASTHRHGSWFEAYLVGACGIQGRWFQKKLEVET